VILFLSWQEADTRFSRDLSVFFPTEDQSKKERVIYHLSSEDSENKLSQRQRKDLARAIIRSADRLELPDGTMLGGKKPDIDLFLYLWAKNRTHFSSKGTSENSIGILGLSVKKIESIEKKTSAVIDRNYDVYNFNIQYKMALILYKEFLSTGMSAKEAYLALFELPTNSNEWEQLEANYIELHRKVIPENI